VTGLSRLASAERRIKAQKIGRPIDRTKPVVQASQAPSFDGKFNEGGERIMLFWKKNIVRKHERGLLFKDGDFINFLAPGTYRYFTLRHRYVVERFDLSNAAFDHHLVNYLIEAERAEIDRLFHVVETQADEVAMVYLNEKVSTVVGPAERKLYWKGVIKVRVERFNFHEEIALDVRLANRLVNGRNSRVQNVVDSVVYARVVPDGHVGLLYVDGELTKTLDAGLHAYWNVAHAVSIELVDLRIKSLEVQGQEILTKDKVALRINVTATYQYVDAAKAFRMAKDPLDQLYKEIVISVGVKDIILPGDMKDLLGKVVEAEKAAQANVIRRREETNATRSLLNTAKVMESNAVALRLKELETLEKITENVGDLSVVGGLDALMNGLVNIKS